MKWFVTNGTKRPTQGVETKQNKKMKINKNNIRWGIVFCAMIIVASRLWAFIDAATTEASLIRISILADHADGAKELSETDPSASVTEAEEMPGLQKYSVKCGETFWINAVLEPNVMTLPPDLRERISMAIFIAGNDGVRVRPLADANLTWQCRFKATDAGTYYVVAYLPSVSIPVKKSEQMEIGKFMRQNEGSKCVTARITVSEASDGAVEPTAQWSESPRPLFELCQSKKQAKPEEILPQMQDAIIPPSVPQPIADSEQQPHIDLSMRSDGEENANDSETDESAASATNSMEVAVVKRVPPETLVTRKKILTEGTLPEIKLQYGAPEEFQTLTVSEWRAICEEYGIIFICGPGEDPDRLSYNKYVMMESDGNKEILEFGQIEKLYGVYFFGLNRFSSEVIQDTENRFGDSVEWYWCNKSRGFLTSRLLLKAVDDAIQDRNLGTGDLPKIKYVEAVLRIAKTAHGKTVAIDVKDVVMNENKTASVPEGDVE